MCIFWFVENGEEGLRLRLRMADSEEEVVFLLCFLHVLTFNINHFYFLLFLRFCHSDNILLSFLQNLWSIYERVKDCAFAAASIANGEDDVLILHVFQLSKQVLKAR